MSEWDEFVKEAAVIVACHDPDAFVDGRKQKTLKAIQEVLPRWMPPSEPQDSEAPEYATNGFHDGLKDGQRCLRRVSARHAKAEVKTKIITNPRYKSALADDEKKVGRLAAVHMTGQTPHLKKRYDRMSETRELQRVRAQFLARDIVRYPGLTVG